MKVLHFYNGSDFFTQEVPWFEWDIEGAKYLMSGAAEAYSILGSIAGNDEKKYAKYKAVFDLVHIALTGFCDGDRCAFRKG